MRVLFFASLLFSYSRTLLAESNCVVPNARYEDIACAIEAFNSVEGQLNHTYKALFESMGSEDRAKLKEAQLAWVQVRDADTAFAYASSGEEGSLGALISTNHKLDITLERIKQLKGFAMDRTN
ncbi:DUF1311 domain-containing protein [Methylomonas sp. SURF-1]|uniref:DUF1311 domain-containing protein n=1 Tax=Methylomonas aurea TaxID=2952224 RepID=A0ABT1UF64_9GAMM|nr:lysozyme inhibitor LprI family protein [Methylomonas sp. SURF-1]MCQ8180777.1 DUF1311 domain-containing protein [Methylomonas sp. SURF-1]